MSDENKRVPGLHAHLGKAQFTDGYLEFVEDGRPVYPDTVYIAEYWRKDQAFHEVIGICATVECAKEQCATYAAKVGIAITKWTDHPKAYSALTDVRLTYFEINPEPLLR